MSWNIEGEFPDFYVTINGVRCVGDSGKPNTIEKCASGNNKDEIWFKFEGEKNGKRLKRSLVEKGNTKFSSAISNAQFLEMCEKMRIPVQRKGKKTVPACTSINVDHEVEPVPTPVPTEVHQDLKILKEKSAGFFTVDLDCLTAPSEELVVRCTDTTWVQQIKESMRSQPSRPVTRIPVLCEREIPPVDFCINTMQPLLTLGGNHMVTAMKDLLIEEAGNPDYECLRKVDVEVYVGLTPREAMFVGSWHNIQCSQKPMNFQDKVRMARKIYESRSTCSSNWKGEVMVALGSLDKKVYKLESLGPVLSVAAYSQENWAAVERIFESHWQESFPQNLFRQLQGVQDKSRTPYLIKAIGTSGLKVAREIAEDKRKDHMKQLAVATLQMGTWEDIEETYTLSDKMLEFTGDLSTPKGRERYCYHVEKLSVNDKDAWTVTITVKKNGIDVPLQPQILQKFTEKIIKTVQKNVTDFEE